MKSAIDRIYLIEQPHFENIKQSKNYWEAFNNFCDLFDGLDEKITEEQKKMLNEIFDVHAEICAEIEQTAYKTGFKFGLQIGFECADID